ncbi:MAG: metal-dependent transcriptional regulator [Candidatus Thermoplasmatota archaeon]|nr:metal-dependent transcriptional regulator [Candidatus Thermoplasmatota archaeon]MCL5731451.1 metal-dependent transcriptional regulator [Candidatus Thermoplasmatota archaeon]
MADTASLTKQDRNCLMIIGHVRSDGFPHRLSEVAHLMGIKPPTLLQNLKRLESEGFVKREKGMINLTEMGRKEYAALVKNHRVIELMLVNNGVPVDDACRTAENVDYVMDRQITDTIFEHLGRPLKCPHGRMISEG